MTFLIVICAIIGIILIINYNGNKHDEEMKKLAAKKKESQSTSSQQNINAKMMGVVHLLGDSNNAHY